MVGRLFPCDIAGLLWQNRRVRVTYDDWLKIPWLMRYCEVLEASNAVRPVKHERIAEVSYFDAFRCTAEEVGH